jgi:hypothetical protein
VIVVVREGVINAGHVGVVPVDDGFRTDASLLDERALRRSKTD